MEIVNVMISFIPDFQTLYSAKQTTEHVDGISLATGVSSMLSQADSSYSQMVGKYIQREEKEEENHSYLVYVLYSIVHLQ